MMQLREKLARVFPVWKEQWRQLLRQHGDKIIAKVTLSQAFGGMRGVRGLICDTSEVTPEKGLAIRGIPIHELKGLLPEAVFFLLVCGELPMGKEVVELQEELRQRAVVPAYVWEVLEKMPRDSHPMAMLSAGILTMERDSLFRKKYCEGMQKDESWIPLFEDCLDLIARLPTLAAGIYRMRFGKGSRIEPRPDLDWAGNYAHMLGIDDSQGAFIDLVRLCMVLYSDHEGGNVSAHACHCVGSALSDPYYAVSAGFNGLAGPLHGRAIEECLRWVLQVRERFGGVPTPEQIRRFSWDTLDMGQLIPGYGHAVLRITDPRFEIFHEFGSRVCPDDPLFQIVDRIYCIAPSVLKEHGKTKDPWPNADAGAGCLLYHFGLEEFEYYTVIFAVSRALGMCAQLIVSRCLGETIERPKSSTLEWLTDHVMERSETFAMESRVEP